MRTRSDAAEGCFWTADLRRWAEVQERRISTSAYVDYDYACDYMRIYAPKNQMKAKNRVIIRSSAQIEERDAHVGHRLGA